VGENLIPMASSSTNLSSSCQVVKPGEKSARMGSTDSSTESKVVLAVKNKKGPGPSSVNIPGTGPKLG
jgi:hypothetical protein